MLSVIMLDVTFKRSMLCVIMMNVIMLTVVAPFQRLEKAYILTYQTSHKKGKLSSYANPTKMVFITDGKLRFTF
jgi:hypothetical protein